MMYGRAFLSLAPLLMMGDRLPGLTGQFRESEAERKIWSMPLRGLVDEYNLIQKKESKLSRRERDMVEARFKYIVEKMKKA